MNREEAINKAIELEFGEGNSKSIRDHNYSIVKVAEHLYDLLQPSFPSNIDDAAEEYFLKTYGIDNIAMSEDIKRAVKFGAKWMMAEQERVANASKMVKLPVDIALKI